MSPEVIKITEYLSEREDMYSNLLKFTKDASEQLAYSTTRAELVNLMTWINSHVVEQTD